MSARPLQLAGLRKVGGIGGDDIAYHAPQLNRFVRLCDHPAEAEIFVTTHSCVHGVATGYDRCNHRIYLLQFPEGFLSTHSTGQGEVEDDEIEAFPADQRFTIKINAFKGSGSAGYCISEATERKID